MAIASKRAFFPTSYGLEFTTQAVPDRMAKVDAKIPFIKPGSQRDHGFVASLNGRLRDECLNENLFSLLRQARHLIAAWRDDYNHHRPHANLDGSTQGIITTKRRTKP